MRTAFREDARGFYVEKDPDATLDYHMAWSRLLDGDTISTAMWTVPAGLTKVSQSVNVSPVVVDRVTHPAGSVATVWLSGGTAGAEYAVTCRVVTVGGRTDERSFRVVMREA
ncbi:MAG: hypothetical protein KIT73_04235 [Burkholderiales bacterium]|nr:hypothetical protein [Burkholderiales bacterium]